MTDLLDTMKRICREEIEASITSIEYLRANIGTLQDAIDHDRKTIQEEMEEVRAYERMLAILEDRDDSR